MTKEEHNRILAAGLAKMPKPKDSTDIDRLFHGCEDQIKLIRAHAQNVGKAWRDGGKDTTKPEFRKMLLEDLQGKFLDLSCGYSSDELRLIMAWYWSLVIIKEVI